MRVSSFLPPPARFSCALFPPRGPAEQCARRPRRSRKVSPDRFSKSRPWLRLRLEFYDRFERKLDTDIFRKLFYWLEECGHRRIHGYGASEWHLQDVGKPKNSGVPKRLKNIWENRGIDLGMKLAILQQATITAPKSLTLPTQIFEGELARISATYTHCEKIKNGR